MKILTINCVDNIYSTGKIIYDLSVALKDDCEFEFCYASGKKSHDNYYRICGKYEYLFYYALGRLLGLKYCTGYTSTNRLLRYIKKQKPDIVHIHCPNVNAFNLPKIISFLKNNNYPTVITNHAEFFYTGNCPHAYDCMKFTTGCGNCNYVFDPVRKYKFDKTAFEWKQMKKAFSGFERLKMVCVSKWMMDRVKLSPIIPENTEVVVIGNGVETDIFKLYNVDDLRKELGFSPDQKILLHVTSSFNDRVDDIKGGVYLIELAKRNPNLKILVAGSYSLKTELPENIILLGKISDSSLLAKYYNIANLSILTSKRETFSMPVAESLCCGTPIIGFKAGGPESVVIPEYSEFCDFGNIDELDLLIKKWIDFKNESNKESISKNALEKYSKEKMANNYFELYKSILFD